MTDDSPDDDSPDDSRACRPEHRPSRMSARRANGPRSARGHSQTHHVDNGDSERLRFCNGPNAEDAAMTLHRGLGPPEPQGMSARWSARKVRCVEIESLSSESLLECGKVQNRKRDLGEALSTLQRAGLEVMGGSIVGFDSEPHDISLRQFDFIQRNGVVTAMDG